MISREDAERFAHDWIDSWNSHDLERILSLYSEDVKYSSPYIAEFGISPDGMLLGAAQVRGYFKGAFKRFPKLAFELHSVAVGVESVVILYKNARNRLAAECFDLDEKGKACAVRCHYAD